MKIFLSLLFFLIVKIGDEDGQICSFWYLYFYGLFYYSFVYSFILVFQSLLGQFMYNRLFFQEEENFLFYREN